MANIRTIPSLQIPESLNGSARVIKLAIINVGQVHQNGNRQQDFLFTGVMGVGTEITHKSCFELVFLGNSLPSLKRLFIFFMSMRLVTYLHECFLESFGITISVSYNKN